MTALRQSIVSDEYSRPVPGAQIYVYDRANAAAQLFSDAGATIPLSQPITSDEFGLYTYYAADGILREDTWYLGKLRFREVYINGTVDVLKGLPGATTAGSYGNRGAIAALTPTALDTVDLTETGREGRFIFDASNLSAKVAIDPDQGIYIAPASDTTGVHGAWVRKFTGPGNINWWGSSTADDTARINRAFVLCPKIVFPGQTYIGTAFVAPAGCQLITDGFSTKFKQKAFTAANTRLLSLLNGASIAGDISVEGNHGQTGDTTGEQNHAIFIYCDATATGDIANVRTGSVDAKNIRGDAIMIGIHPTAYGAGHRVSNINVGRVTGDNIFRNGVSFVGGSTIRVAAVECTHVGLFDWDVEPDIGSGPAVDVKVGYTKGQYIVLGGPTAADYCDAIDAGVLELNGGGSAPQTSSPAYPLTRTHAIQIRNTKQWSYSSLKADNYNGQAIKQIYNGGELAAQRHELGKTDLTNCALTDTVYRAFIVGSPGVTDLSIAALTATATLSTHIIVISCYGAEIHKPVVTGPSAAWKFLNDCAGSSVYGINQIHGYAAIGSAGVRFVGGSFNGDTFFNFSDDATAYDVAVVASTAPNVGGNGVKFYGGSLGGVRNTLTYYNASSILVTIDGAGIVTGYEVHASSLLKGYLYDNSGNQVVGQRGVAIANVPGSAGPTPTGAEHNAVATGVNAILAQMRLDGKIAP